MIMAWKVEAAAAGEAGGGGRETVTETDLFGIHSSDSFTSVTFLF